MNILYTVLDYVRSGAAVSCYGVCMALSVVSHAVVGLADSFLKLGDMVSPICNDNDDEGDGIGE